MLYFSQMKACLLFHSANNVDKLNNAIWPGHFLHFIPTVVGDPKSWWGKHPFQEAAPHNYHPSVPTFVISTKHNAHLSWHYKFIIQSSSFQRYYLFHYLRLALVMFSLLHHVNHQRCSYQPWLSDELLKWVAAWGMSGKFIKEKCLT